MMKRKIILMIFSVLSICFLADYIFGKTITNKILNQFYNSNVQKSKMVKVVTFNHDKYGQLKFEIIYQSPEKRHYLMTGNAQMTYNEKVEYNKIKCYELRISSNRQKDILKSFSKNELSEKINYLNNQIQTDFKLINGKDSLPCVMSHFERNFGIAPYLSIQIAFENKKIHDVQELSIIYNDQLLNQGKIKLNANH